MAARTAASGKPQRTRTAPQALAFLRRQGVLRVAAGGMGPSLVEYIAGAPIRGSWWGHPDSAAIFGMLNDVAASPDVRMLRLLDGKVTLVHRRVWPALARLAKHFPKGSLEAVTQEHTAQGRHRAVRTPFPRWMPPGDQAEGRKLTESAAWLALPAALHPPRGIPGAKRPTTPAGKVRTKARSARAKR